MLLLCRSWLQQSPDLLRSQFVRLPIAGRVANVLGAPIAEVEKDGANYKVTGNLTLLGKTKAVTFPATVTASADALTVTANFSIDRTEWGMNYGKGKVDDLVKLSVSVNAKAK